MTEAPPVANPGTQHVLPIGSPEQDRAVLGMAGRAKLFDFSKIRGHPEFLLMKGR